MLIHVLSPVNITTLRMKSRSKEARHLRETPSGTFMVTSCSQASLLFFKAASQSHVTADFWKGHGMVACRVSGSLTFSSDSNLMLSTAGPVSPASASILVGRRFL